MGPGELEIFIPSDFFPELAEKSKNMKTNELEKKKLFLKQEIARCEKLLNNEKFISKAPPELIEKETKKLIKLRNYQKLVKEEENKDKLS